MGDEVRCFGVKTLPTTRFQVRGVWVQGEVTQNARRRQAVSSDNQTVRLSCHLTEHDGARNELFDLCSFYLVGFVLFDVRRVEDVFVFVVVVFFDAVGVRF